MKTKNVIAVFLTVLSGLFFAAKSPAQTVATQSGPWSSSSTWGGMTPPTGTATAEINEGIIVTVDTNISVTNIDAATTPGGTVVMGAGNTLTITQDGPLGDWGGFINATAPGNTVVYSGNPYSVADTATPATTNYYNLSVVTPFGGTLYNAVAMNVAGTLYIDGVAGVQAGAPWYINNLVITNDAQFNASINPFLVTNSTIIDSPGTNNPSNPTPYHAFGTGGLFDSSGQNQNLNDQLHDVTVNSNGVWNMGDVVEWAVSGNLTNFGNISGTAYARITLNGAGVLAGNPISVPCMSFYGTNTLETFVTNSFTPITTNTDVIGFDLATPGELICPPGTNGGNGVILYGGNLNLVDTGTPPNNGTVFQLFSATNYPGAFLNINSTFSFVNNLSTSGSITFTGGGTPSAPKITNFQYNHAAQQVTLTWTSSNGSAYSVLESPTLATVPSSWSKLTNGVPATGTSTTVTLGVPVSNTAFIEVSSP